MAGGVDDNVSAELTQVFDQYRPLLFSIAYTILGIVSDTQDLMEETFRCWLQTSDHNPKRARTFLVTTIATLCIDHLQYAAFPDTKSASLDQKIKPPECSMDSCLADSSISLAFLTMLNRLTHTERIIFLLRTIFRYEFSQIAQVVGKDEEQCQQVAERIKAYMAGNRADLDMNPYLYMSQI